MSGLLAIGLVVLVGALAWWLRRSAVSATPSATPPSEGHVESEPEAEDEDDGTEVELAITSDGVVLIPDGYTVRMIPLDPGEVETHQEDIESGVLALSPRDRLMLASRSGKPGQALSAGDFTAARIKRGAADVVPWLLETLGRDGEYIPMAFETEDGARAALSLIERYKIVRRPLDENDRPIPPSPEDFEEAKRRYDDSWQALAMEQEPGDEAGPPYSDRR